MTVKRADRFKAEQLVTVKQMARRVDAIVVKDDGGDTVRVDIGGEQKTVPREKIVAKPKARTPIGVSSFLRPAIPPPPLPPAEHTARAPHVDLTKKPPLRSEAYKSYVRQHPCIGPHCRTPFDRVESHHYGEHGMSIKTDDYRTVPLCHDCHYEQFHRHLTLKGLTVEETDALFVREQAKLFLPWARAKRGDLAVDEAIMNALVALMR